MGYERDPYLEQDITILDRAERVYLAVTSWAGSLNASDRFLFWLAIATEPPTGRPRWTGRAICFSPMLSPRVLTIREVIDRHPETLPVFAANGLALFADEATRATFGAAVRLRTALKAAGINAELLSRTLVEAMAAATSRGDGQESLPPAHPNLNLFALLPCPLKVPLEEAFTGFLATLPAAQRAGLTFCIEGNANNQLDYADYAGHFETLADMPDIIITSGFNSFFHPHFVERFIKTGQFASVTSFAGDRHLAAMGITDPDGHYSMLAMNLLAFHKDFGAAGLASLGPTSPGAGTRHRWSRRPAAAVRIPRPSVSCRSSLPTPSADGTRSVSSGPVTAPWSARLPCWSRRTSAKSYGNSSRS